MKHEELYAPIHCRTHYSFLRGVLSPQEVVERACSMGATAAGVADINGFYGLVRFASAARERGLKPLYGTALYAGEEYLCTLLCLNGAGFARANVVLSRHIETRERGGEYDPISDLQEDGWPGLWIVTHRRDIAERLLQRGGENLFAGLPYGVPYSETRRWASEIGVGVLAYNDAVYLRNEDRRFFKVVRAIGLNTLFDTVGEAGELSGDKRFAGADEMRSFFSGVPEALETARRYAALSEGFQFPDRYIFPRFRGLSEEDAFERLRRLCLNGVRRRYGIEPFVSARPAGNSVPPFSSGNTVLTAGGLSNPEGCNVLTGVTGENSNADSDARTGASDADSGVGTGENSDARTGASDADSDALRRQVLHRLNYELKIIRYKGFASYFLVVHDIVKRIPRTCGRGSAAAGIVTFLLGITHVDPLRYNLFFERFLNMGRRDPPDIDVDFPWDERDKALKYVFETYPGSSAMVADHVTFARRSAIREPARVMGYEQEQLKRFSGLWRRGRLSELPEELRSVVPRLYGMPRYLGTHPGGVIITPGPITQYTHVQRSPLGWPVIAWEKDAAEDAGLVKIDLLGNRSLGVLRDSIDLINTRHHTRIEWESFSPLKNRAARELVSRGDTLGVFYVESPATRQLLQKMGRGDYEHLVIASSIIRPAANRYINEFVRRLRGGAYRRFPDPVGKVLEETYGIMVYQEDVSRVSIAAAGFKPAEADALRKVLSKKDRERRLPFFKERFFHGARQRGFGEAVVHELWDAVLSFEGYSFCKPHSASYALLSYRLAWVKRFFPLEFFASVINNGGGFYSRQVYVNAVRRMGFSLHGPDVNHSSDCYTIEPDGRGLRVGLGQLQELSRKAVRLISEDRLLNGQFTDVYDFCRRIQPDMASFRSLVRSGALDSIACGHTRPQMFWLYYHHSEEPGFFLPPKVPDFIGDYPAGMKLLDEYRSTALILSRHPLEIFRSRIERRRNGEIPLVDTRSLDSYVGAVVRIAGFMVTEKEIRTRFKQEMSFVSFEDAFGIFETVVFPEVYQRLALLLEEGVAFILEGKVEKEWGALQIQVRNLTPLSRGGRESLQAKVSYFH